MQLAFYFHVLTTMHGQSHIKNYDLFAFFLHVTYKRCMETRECSFAHGVL